jgi:hypothetical protein
MFVQLRRLKLTPFVISELGNVFAGGNLPQGHEYFEKDHLCNKFCTFFDIPTDYKIWESRSSIARPHGTGDYGH